jgi:hypothetical protein
MNYDEREGPKVQASLGGKIISPTKKMLTNFSFLQRERPLFCQVPTAPPGVPYEVVTLGRLM